MADRRPINERNTELDRLFALAPEQFTNARNELVAKLKASGDEKRASQIKALSKPTLAIWAINQLARLRPDKIAALLEAGERLRTAQGRALRSKDSPVNLLRAAAQSERQALGELIRAAEEVLASSGHPQSASLLGRIETTLHATAVGNGAERELLRAGHLSRELQAVGFPTAVGGVTVASSLSRAAEQQAPRPDRREELQQMRAEARRAQREEKALAAALRKSERLAQRLRLRAEQAETAATRARREFAAAQQAVAAVRERLTDAKRRLERSNAALVAATAKQ